MSMTMESNSYGFIFVLCVFLFFGNTKTSSNMNGDYMLTDPKTGNHIKRDFTTFSNYPGGTEYFDVYSPLITSYYAQVFWTRMEEVKLPQNIIDRFDNKAMAIVGFEVDQVMKTPNGDVSVPINVAYNHHFESEMVGKHAAIEKVTDPDDPRIPDFYGHGRPDPNVAYIIHDTRESDDNEVPVSQAFGAGNGGEYRKSFHGYAPGYAQAIESPTSMYITPMQIDTWNREKMNSTGGSPFVSGPVPRNSLAPQSGQDALYSGLLECPVTTRIRKVVENAEYGISISSPCSVEISSFSECFEAIHSIVNSTNATVYTKTLKSESYPVGCTMNVSSYSISTPMIVHAVYNEVEDMSNSNTKCENNKILKSVGSTSSLVHLSLELEWSKGTSNITITGPSDVWFGVGLNASKMGDQPYAIIVDGSGNVSERKLADQGPGTLLEPSVKIISNKESNGIRTVVLTRPIYGATNEHFTFNVDDPELPFINAIGSTVELSYHKEKTSSVIKIFPIGSSTCVCGVNDIPFGQAKGSLKYENTSIGFGNTCKPEPASDLLRQKNPTCDVRTYSGGQTACHHLWYLLDEDQTLPWQDKPLQYHLKFRFHYQEYNASYHKPMYRTSWGIASPVEYDVPQCANGTPPEECIHTITGSFKIGQYNGKNISLVSAHFHCHAPT